MILFPAFLKLEGRRCLVVGAGAIAEEKIQGLLATGAVITVVAPQATPQIRDWAHAGKLKWEQREYRSGDLNGIFLVIAATSSAGLDAEIYSQARRHGALCNAVDDPEHCDFYYGSVVRRGALQIAISTAGLSPALAQRLRKRFETEFGEEYERWLEELGAERKKLFAQSISPEQRREQLHRLASEDAFEEFLARTKQKKK